MCSAHTGTAMTSIIRYTVIFMILLLASSVDAAPTASVRPTPQPLIGNPYIKIQYYKPVNQHVNENQSFVRWVNIIKASQRVAKKRTRTIGTK